MKTVALADIVFDAGTQIRAAISEDVVTDYAERLGEGVMFPPVILFHDGNRYYMADGFHRAMASQRVGATLISADVQAGTKADALWFALGANRANGHRLTRADKRHAILLALETWPMKSVRSIAEQVGCDHSYVVKLKPEPQVVTDSPPDRRVIGRDGKSYPATKPLSAPKSHPKMDEILTMLHAGKNPTAIAAELGVAPETIQKVRRAAGLKWTEKSRGAVAQRKLRMRELASEGYTSHQIAAEVGIGFENCRAIMRQEGIDVVADRAMANTKQPNAARIIDQMAMDAENLTADIGLIDFNGLDRSRLAAWLRSFTTAQDNLGKFIRRLMKEQQKHGEAA